MPSLNPLCTGQTADGFPCGRPAMTGHAYCWSHLAMATLGRTHPPHGHSRPCTARNRADAPCGGYVAYNWPDADAHDICYIHYQQHLRDRDRKPTSGCGCFTTAGRTPRRAKSSP